jgi:hypothetical protein
MAKSNIRGILADGQKSFAESLADLETVIVAEVPISINDKKGSRAIIQELNKMPFIIQNVDKVDEHLPKNFNASVFAEDDALLKEKQLQLQELHRLAGIVESQIAVKRIGMKSNVREFYNASKKAAEKNVSLKYIYTTMQECYTRVPKAVATELVVKTVEAAESNAAKPAKGTA